MGQGFEVSVLEMMDGLLNNPLERKKGADALDDGRSYLAIQAKVSFPQRYSTPFTVGRNDSRERLETKRAQKATLSPAAKAARREKKLQNRSLYLV